MAGDDPGGLGEVIEAELHAKRRPAATVDQRSMPYHGGGPGR